MQTLLHKATSLSASGPGSLPIGVRPPGQVRRRPAISAEEPCSQPIAHYHVNVIPREISRSRSCSAASTTSRGDSAVFRHPGELDLNLREYMVVLEKPVGLTLAPDPRTGQVVVQDIKPNSPAYKCGLIQVGDVVKSCSAVFGDDMWPAVDLRRVRWAINSRLGDVRLVLERAARKPGPGVLTAWYCGGKAGVVTRERDGMQLPYSFNSNPTLDDSGSFLDLPGAGKSMMVAFHRNTVTQPPPSRRASSAAAAHAAALQRLRRELLEARGMPRLDLSSSLHPRPGGPDSFVLPPPATASASIAARGGPSAAGAAGKAPGSGSSGLRASTSSLNGGGGSGGGAGGEAGPPPPPPPVVDVVAPAPPSASSSGEGPSSGSNSGGSGGGLMAALRTGGSGSSGPMAAASAAGGGGALGASPPPKERRVVTFLPWLLVACGRLEHRHIAHIASSRSLGALLELSLTRSQPQQQPQLQLQATPAPLPPQAGAGAGAPAEAPSGSSGGDNASGKAAGAAASGGSGPSSGGYLVVRGSDLMPLASDVGRVSYQALLAAAAAAAAGSSSGAPPPPPSPSGEAPPPPPPGSAAATAAMINGTDVPIAGVVGGSSLLGGSSVPGTGPLFTGNVGSSSNGNGNGSKNGNSGAAAGTEGGSGLASSTMAFLNRSIFLNLRPNPAAPKPFSGAATAGGSAAAAAAAGPGAPSSQPPAFSALPTSRYDAGRVRHLLNAAASLQRLTFRRGGRLHRARRDQCAVMLHCDEGLEGDVAVLLAGWLHWYGRLPLQEASLAAETAIGATVDQGLLEAGTAALLQGARERCSRVVLTWKYGGLSAYVAGDVVASWAARVPMVRCRSPLGCKGDTHPGHFYLEVQGLRPGIYYYKYIVDGTWAVDSLSSKVLDSAGNWNNVLVVPEPPLVLTSREGLALARWQAARLAFEAKMGLQGPGSLRPM